MPEWNTPPEWVRDYVGIPYLPRGRARTDGGLDCWGLFRLIYLEQFQIELPSYADDISFESRADIYDINQFLTTNLDPEEWLEVLDRGDTDIGDGLLISLGGRPIHVAVAVSSQHMVHIVDMPNRRGQEIGLSTIERFSGAMWDKRILGIYRHATRW